MGKYRYLLFDLDDTLLDFSKAEHLAFLEASDEIGIHEAEKMYRDYHRINEGLWKKLEEGGITIEDLKVERFRQTLIYHGFGDDSDRLANEYKETYENRLGEHGEPLAESERILKTIHGRYGIYAITNGSKTVQGPRIEKSGLAVYFTKVYISHDIGFSKPDRRFFEYVLDDIGDHDKSRYLVIGDSLSSDCDGAILSGIDICRFNPKGLPPEGRKLTYDITDLGELENILIRDKGEKH